MGRTYVALLAVLLMGAGGPEKKAVARLALAEAADRAVAESEPGWTLARTVEDESGISKTWRPIPKRESENQPTTDDGSEELAVQIRLRAIKSESEAAEEFKLSLLGIAIGRGDKVEKLGDEGYVWVNYNGRGKTRTYFRRSNYLISVAGPSADVTDRFSGHMLDAVEERIKAIEK